MREGALVVVSSIVSLPLTVSNQIATEMSSFGSRDVHGYRFTRGASKTGTAGTGTVLGFSTPQHTVYPYCGVTGIHGLI